MNVLTKYEVILLTSEGPKGRRKREDPAIPERYRRTGLTNVQGLT